MTGVALALAVLGLFVLQAPEQGKPREQAPPVDLSPSAPAAPSPTLPGGKAFGQLFEQAQEHAARRALANQKHGRKIVCGMVVIEADPSIDPKILMPPPVDSGTAKIRRIVPPTCTE
jgi:hypothetical protein